MKMNKVLFFTAFLLLSVNLCSQTFTIYGCVQDSESKENLINAAIADNTTGNYAVSNSYGFYSLTLPANKNIELSISYLGYAEKKMNIKLVNDTVINFYLQQSNEIEQVVISSNEILADDNLFDISTNSIDNQLIKHLPTITGEKDILRTYQLMPGINFGKEGSAGIFVRGGSPDQNLIIADEIPLYYVYHLGGLYSVFDADVVSTSKIYKGGFPAQYGGRLSSVLDIRIKDGDKQAPNGTVSVGIFASKISVDGPIKKGKSSYLLSARRSNLDIFTRLWAKLNSSNTLWAYSFYDVHAKYNQYLSAKSNLYFSFYSGRDNNLNKEKTISIHEEMNHRNQITWGNTYGSVRYTYRHSKKVFANYMLAYTRFNYKTNFESTEKDITSNSSKRTNEYNFSSQVADIIGKANYDFYVSQNYTMKYGLSAVWHTFIPVYTKSESSATHTPDIEIQTSPVHTFENSAYVENRFTVKSILSSNIGLRFNAYHTGRKAYLSVQPRVVTSFQISKKSVAKLSYARMNQPVHLVSATNRSMPSDLWLPSTKEIEPEISNQFTAAFELTIPQNKYNFSVELFYKDLQNLIKFKPGTFILNNSKSWQEKTQSNGIGYAFGAELLFKKEIGKITGWVSYSYSQTKYKFTDYNSDNFFLSNYDRPHDAAIVVIYHLNKSVSISSNWVYTSGNPMTLAFSKYTGINFDYSQNSLGNVYQKDIHIYSERNNYRLPPHHRLDLNVSFEKQKKRGIRTFSFGVYNVYNRKNAYYVFLKVSDGRIKLFQQSLFPIIPSVSYSFKFKSSGKD